MSSYPQMSHASSQASSAGPHAVPLGHPRLHLRSTTSTNDRARELAIGGAPHGTLVTADEQTAGRGRQGRRWSAPARSSLLMSLILRSGPPEGRSPISTPMPSTLPLLVAVAVCDVLGPRARVKWPNDIVVEDGPVLRKLAGILVEGRPQEGWAVLGVGVNVAVSLDKMPGDLRETAASLDLSAEAIEPTLALLLDTLERRLTEPIEAALDSWRELDALRGREVSWGEGAHRGDRQAGEACQRGRAEGIDGTGRLVVMLANRHRTTLEGGEVHLRDARPDRP